MYRSPHPGMVYYNPRDNVQQRFQFPPRSSPDPRAFQWRNKVFHPRPLIGNHEEHWCETCDRGFPNEFLLNQHKQQHQKCNIDGCQFVAHPKVITKHIQMQHSTGLYKKIAKLHTPEEINKWREERKKKYPTISNIEKKAAEVKEKIDRGEKMGLKQDRGFSNSKPDIGRKRNHDSANENRHNRTNFKRNNSTFQANGTHKKYGRGPKNIPKTLPPVYDKRRLQPFTGIKDIVISDTEENVEISDTNDFIEDDICEEISVISNDTLSNTKQTVCSALSSLMCDYGSSDENDDEIKLNKISENCADNLKPQINIIQQCEPKDCFNTVNNQPNDIQQMNDNDSQTSSLQQNPVEKPNKSDDESGPEEVTTVKNKFQEIETDKVPISKDKNVTRKKKHEAINGYKAVIARKPKPKIPSTLLRKLLVKEMRQERNIVLQCIRYIRRNNYFDK